MTSSLQPDALNTIRFLSADAVQQANSGHPGLPMGATEIAYAIWARHLRHNPQDPAWFNRDRFILSGGHGSMLLYSLLHLTGYDLPLEEIINFRQWGSRTPGHPEYGHTPGVEMTTGPLGQGFATGVGFAIAEAHLAARFNQPGHKIIDHYTYGLVTDGDLMEGVAAEAASLAGHLQLGKLIYLYDDNHISIEGDTNITFTEDARARFEAYGWHTQIVANGHDVEAIDSAIQIAQPDPRPSIIFCRTILGRGLPTRENTPQAHGAPPGDDELNAAKEKLGWPIEPRFIIPPDVLQHFRTAESRGAQQQAEWEHQFDAYRAAHPGLAAELQRLLAGELPDSWADSVPVFPADAKGLATRASSGKVLNALAPILPELFGGSADLNSSNKTWIADVPAFQHDTPHGRNFHFGVREHAMGAVMNGMVLHGGFIPYGGTFLVFADYVRPAIRLSALMGLRTIWVFTHDSIGLGEDGPTHQPIEHLASLRAIPNLLVLRPADANETAEAWKVALTRKQTPTVLALSRQSLPTLDRQMFDPASGLQRGAYILADLGDDDPELILMASGSEVPLIVEAGLKLVAEGLNVRLVSFPSWELFAEQDQDYRDRVLPPGISARLAVEAGISQGWRRWVGDRGALITLDRFGASAPAGVLFEKFGFTPENVYRKAMELMQGR